MGSVFEGVWILRQYPIYVGFGTRYVSDRFLDN
jgi:hypothetical protein